MDDLKPQPVEVVYAASATDITRLQLEPQTDESLGSIIERCGVLERYPQLDLRALRIGVFGRLRHLADPVHAGDRIEIYRPLVADPKAARRRRAAHSRLKAGVRPD